MAKEKLYISVEKEAEAEITEKKSKFIANICHVETEDEAMLFVEKIKEKHSDARHNVYAYVLSGGVKKYTDGGEPSKTAGFPVMELFDKQGLSDVVCVVTRYFGGILLGTGGLIRAYTEAAKQAINAAGVVTMNKCDLIELTLPYSMLGSVEHLIRNFGAIQEDKEYAEYITLTISVDCNKSEAFSQTIKNDFSGGIKLHWKGQVYRKV